VDLSGDREKRFFVAGGEDDAGADGCERAGGGGADAAAGARDDRDLAFEQSSGRRRAFRCGVGDCHGHLLSRGCDRGTST
jgi:hypothetical protein